MMAKKSNIKITISMDDREIKRRIHDMMLFVQSEEAIRAFQAKCRANLMITISPKRSSLSDVSFPATGDCSPEELL